VNEPTQAAERASRSSFYTGMRILPPAQREAMFEIYSFCRAVDDIADDPGPRDARRRQLADWRSAIDAVYAGTPPPQLLGLAAAVRQFDLKREDFIAVIDGMEMDVIADIRAPDRPTLDLYCDRVACAVGRLSVRVFGMPPEPGVALAHHLGRALQLTNILRDLDEDAHADRLYLPSEALAVAGISERAPRRAVSHPNIAAACLAVAARARGHFASAATIMNACPRAATRSPRLMAIVYGDLLDRLVAQGFSAPRTRVRVAKARLLWAVVRHGLF